MTALQFRPNKTTRVQPETICVDARLIAGCFLLVGILMCVAPRASPGLLLALVVCTAAVGVRDGVLHRSLTSLRDPVVPLLAFAGWAALSAAWTLPSLEGLSQATWFAVVVTGTHVVATRVAGEKPLALILMAGWLAVGFFLGCAYLAHAVATDQSLLLWLLNTFPVFRPSSNKMQIVVDGQVAAISPANLKWSIAGLSLLLWPVLLLVSRLWQGLAGLCVAGGLFAVAFALVALTTHTTSQIAIAIAIPTFLASLRWPGALHRVVATAWVAAFVAVVPLSLLVHQGGLQKMSWMPATGKQRLEMWNYTAQQVFQAPVIGHGARFSYVAHAERPKDSIQPELAAGGIIDRPLRHPHNIYLQTWYELGALGVVLLVIAGLSLLEKIARLPSAERAMAHAAWITSMAVLTSTWELWQGWLVAAFALSVLAGHLAVRVAAVTAHFTARSGAAFSAIALPQNLKHPALFLIIMAIGTFIVVSLIDRYNNLVIESRIQNLADCQRATSRDCISQASLLAEVLAGRPRHQSLSRWWPTRFRVYKVDDIIVYFRPRCSENDIAVDLFVLTVWPRDPSILPQDRKLYGFFNHSFYFSGKPYAGAHTGVGYRVGNACLAVALLPTANVAKITVGQYISAAKSVVWSHEIAFP